MQPVVRTHQVHGRVVAVGPGLVDVELVAEEGAAERLFAQLAFAIEHRIRVELRGDGPLAGAHGRITSDFVVSADGAVAKHEVVLSIHTEGGGPRS
jgi:hypothetical protein